MNDPRQSFASAMQEAGLDRPQPRLAVAVSGGGDSMALALLAQEWTVARRGELVAFTVDHGLRPQSAAEAEKAGVLLAARGIRHRILRWEGEKPATHIQERARAARYRLLLDACRAEGVDTLAIAHNLEDQAETFWMRLSRGSGLDGLAGMAPLRHVEGIAVVRPLLGLSRAALREVCRAADVPWIDDPSNENAQFLRVKLRQFEELLAAEGLTPQRLALVMHKLGEARAALQAVTWLALERSVAFCPEGFVRLNADFFKEQPADVQRRMLEEILQRVAPQAYAPGHEALEQVRLALLAGEFPGRTLAGCDIFPGPAGEFLVCREADAAAPPAPLHDGLVWDGRLEVSCYRASPAFTIGILGEEGVGSLRKRLEGSSAVSVAFEALPYKVKKSLAAVRDGEKILAIPQLNWLEASAPAELRELRATWLGMPGREGGPRNDCLSLS